MLYLLVTQHAEILWDAHAGVGDEHVNRPCAVDQGAYLFEIGEIGRHRAGGRTEQADQPTQFRLPPTCDRETAAP